MRAAADHHVGVAAPENFGRFADRLRAGRTGGEAIEGRPACAGQHRQVRQRHVRLLLDLARHVHSGRCDRGPSARIDRRRIRDVTGQRGSSVGFEIERTFAAGEVDPDTVEIKRTRFQLRGFPRLCASGQSELRVATRAVVGVGGSDMLREAEAADLSTDTRGEGVGVEEGRHADAGFAREQALPDRFDRLAHRRDPAHARDDNALHAAEFSGRRCDRERACADVGRHSLIIRSRETKRARVRAIVRAPSRPRS